MAQMLRHRPQQTELPSDAELMERLQALCVPLDLPAASNSTTNDQRLAADSVDPFDTRDSISAPDKQRDVASPSQASSVRLIDDRSSIYSNLTSVGPHDPSSEDLIALRSRDVEGRHFDRSWRARAKSMLDPRSRVVVSDTASQLTAVETDKFERASVMSGFSGVIRMSPYSPRNLDAALPNRKELADIQLVMDSMQSAMSIRNGASLLETRIRAALDAGMSPEAGFRWRGIRHECYDQGAPLLLIITGMSRFTTGLLPIAKLLLERGANPDGPDDHWRRPLMKAVKWNAELVPILLAYGANPNIQKGDKMPPLFRASTSEVTDRKVLKALLDAGADLDCVDSFDRNVLHYFFIDAAYRGNNLDNARYLIEQGPDLLNREDCVGLRPYDLGLKMDPARKHRGAALNPFRRQGGYNALLDLVVPRGQAGASSRGHRRHVSNAAEMDSIYSGRHEADGTSCEARELDGSGSKRSAELEAGLSDPVEMDGRGRRIGELDGTNTPVYELDVTKGRE